MHIALFIPGLPGPEARYSREFLPQAPALDRLLSRGNRVAAPPGTIHRVLAQLFGCAPPRGSDVPVAAVTRLADMAGPADGIWMRADPVHLRADRRSVILLDADIIGLEPDDALALAAELRPTLESRGFGLEVPCARRWYLRLARMPALLTRELDEVSGRDIAGAMPAGGNAPEWLRLLNEVQVTLHASKVNDARAARGLPPVNSLWFWGCGTAPAPDAPRWSAIHGADLFLRGLAQLTGASCLPVPAGADAVLAGAAAGARVLIMHDGCRRAAGYQDVETWSAAVAALERDWFGPMERALRAGRLRSLSLITGGLQVNAMPWHLLRFWRRRPILAHMAPGAALQ